MRTRTRMSRRNPGDDRIRQLERAAATGDSDARLALAIERERRDGAATALQHDLEELLAAAIRESKTAGYRRKNHMTILQIRWALAVAILGRFPPSRSKFTASRHEAGIGYVVDDIAANLDRARNPRIACLVVADKDLVTIGVRWGAISADMAVYSPWALEGELTVWEWVPWATKQASDRVRVPREVAERWLFLSDHGLFEKR